MDNFPALTVKQPWAKLIMLGVKNIENRSWSTDYRGRIFIHAGQGWDDSPWPDDPGLVLLDVERFTRDRITGGVILGTVELTDIRTDHTSPWARKGDHQWVLEHPHSFFRPVPWRGQQGLWWPTRFHS